MQACGTNCWFVVNGNSPFCLRCFGFLTIGYCKQGEYFLFLQKYVKLLDWKLMKKWVLLFGLALFCGIEAVDAQAVRKKARVRKFPTTVSDVLKKRSSKAVQRIQPAASVTYSVVDGVQQEFPQRDEYDAYGQKIAFYYLHTIGSDGILSWTVQRKTYDYSKGYPVMLDRFSYVEDVQTQEVTDLQYWQRTTMENGVRTALEVDEFDTVELDAAGHITHTREKTDEFTSDVYYTWNGDLPTSYREVYEEYDYWGNGSVVYMSDLHITDIQKVYEVEPFNAYDFDCVDAWWDATWLCNAQGTAMEDGESFNVVLTGTVSDDKKVLTQTIKAGTMLDDVIVRTYIDDNGSYTLVDTDNSYGQWYVTKETNKFNEMGDLTEYIMEESGEFSSEPDDEYVYNSITVFERWHDAASVSDVAADAEVLGADVYTLDGVKVTELSADEVADVKAHVQESGVYIVVKKTSQGTVVEKLAMGR